MSKRSDTKTTRRRFMTVAAAGGAAIAMPQVSRAQTATLKMQGSWGKADVFNEMAEDYVKRVHDMAGSRLRIDYLVGGAVVQDRKSTRLNSSHLKLSRMPSSA